MTDEEREYDLDEEQIKESKKLAAQELANEDLEAFVLVTYDGKDTSVTLEADFMEPQTEMPMPQALLATLIYNYSVQTGRRPMRIGQAATYAAEQIFQNPTEFDFVTDMNEVIQQEQER